MSELTNYDSPEWFQLPDKYKAAAIEQDFNNLYGNDPNYANADFGTQEKYRVAHRLYAEETAANSANNPKWGQQQQNQQTADNRGVLANTLAIGANSMREQIQFRAPMADDLFTEEQTKYAQQVVALYDKRQTNPMTYEQKQLATGITNVIGTWENPESTGWDKAKATAAFIGKDVIGNPGGVLHTGAESISSLAAYAMGAWGGAKIGGAVGAITGPGAAVSATIGAAGGMITAATIDSGTHKMHEEIISTMEEQGYQITPTNVAQFLKNNPNFKEEAQTKSLKYGAALGVIDVVLGGLVSRIATLPARAARQAAMRSIDDVTRAKLSAAAAEQGIPEKQFVDSIIDGTARNIYKARSFKQKVAQSSGAYAGEVASEPLSEAGATAFVGDEIKAEDLIYETIGGIGAGPLGAAINTAALGSKAGSKKSANLVKKILTDTPESRQAVKEVKAETKAAKVLREKPAEANYTKDLESIEIGDPRIDQWADPTNEKEYNPIKAVQAIAKFDSDPDASDKAQNILNNVIEDIFVSSDKYDEITAKAEKENRELNPQEDALARNLLKVIEQKKGILSQVQAHVEVIQGKNNKAAADNKVAPINLNTATSQEVIDHSNDIFGSMDTDLDIKQLDNRLSRKDLPSEERVVLQSMKEAAVAKKELQTLNKRSTPNTDGKTVAEVQNDIYYGSHDFKGINSFKQAISNFIKTGNTAGATTQIEKLTEFRNSRQAKRDLFIKTFEEISKVKFDRKTEKRPETQIRFGDRTYNIHVNSGKLIEAVKAEANALEKEVIAAESLLAAKSAPKNTNPKVAAPSSSQSPSEAPAAKRKLSDTVIKKTKEYAQKMAAAVVAGKASDGVVLQREKEIRDKHGKAVGDLFRKELTIATKIAKEKVDAKSKVQAKEQAESKVEDKQAPESPQDQRSEADPAPTIKTIKPRTKAQQEADKNRGKINIEKDDILVAIGKLGGIQIDQFGDKDVQFTDEGKPGGVFRKKQRVGFPVLRRKKGMTLDDMRRALVESGYLKEGATIEDLRSAILDAIQGKEIKSVQAEVETINTDSMSDAEAAYYANLEIDGVEITEQEYSDTGFDELNEQQQEVASDIINSIPDSGESNETSSDPWADFRRELGAEDSGTAIRRARTSNQSAQESFQFDSEQTEEKVTSALIAERRDVAGLLRLLGVENNNDPNHVGTYEEILKSQEALIEMIASGTIDKAALTSLFSWLHTTDIDLTKERYERATYKTYDHKTGKPLSKEQVQKNKEKFELRSKGNTDQFIAMQVAEELNELLNEKIESMGESVHIDIYMNLEAQKRLVKAFRFGEDTIIKDESSFYFGKTNKEAADIAVSNVGIENAEQKSIERLILDLNKELQKLIISTNSNNTDNVVTESIDTNQMPVTFVDVDGTQITKPYDQAIVDMTTELKEVEAILNCITLKK